MLEDIAVLFASHYNEGFDDGLLAGRARERGDWEKLFGSYANAVKIAQRMNAEEDNRNIRAPGTWPNSLYEEGA